ncbi:ABC transporter ATP-binding protein [Roseovarius sp. SCSIO 43702]|uniref:ABC transporter ATP-binding protein n=1 Tax=Roseovarius sp. SCSIO 43702 TaxID=2823043 RepID=UPI001C729F4F|nr:ABC transporter ATP-binding protein [Roseovarius sp. SCSIO 43702]QYX58307.1 ABC transporter ATP-binding protein [Roseovarius sp. SCSIO 43702]
MLRIEGLVKDFGGLRALAGLDFEVPERSILGVLGMNGSGKTTMLNCINGIYIASSGSIRLEGTELIGLKPAQVFEHGVGRTFQVPRVFPRMTLWDNLAVPLLSRSLNRAERDEIRITWLKKVQLYDLRHNYAEELSGGQQKLLELARIMVARPKLVLLDEPFAGVNPTLSRLLIDVIREMPEDTGCSVILVSHDLTSIYELSHDIIVMHEGRILARGDAATVQANPDVIEAYLGA